MPGRTRVDLPAAVKGDFTVYLNGVLQVPGSDYEQVGRSLFFPRLLQKEGPLGFWRWAGILFGVIGTYRQNDSVDVVYEAGGRRVVAAKLPVEPVP